LATAAPPLKVRGAFFGKYAMIEKVGLCRRCAKALPLGARKLMEKCDAER